MKRIGKRLVTVICGLALFIGCGEIWKYLLVDDTTSYTRIMMHQLYNANENIDVLFVGSSHVYRSIIPEITDVVFGCYTFNAGSSSQNMDGSLAIIKEAAKHNDIKQVYLELYYAIAYDGEYSNRSELTSTYIISDYMKPSLNKVIYLINASSKKYWSNSFIVSRRNWSNFFDSNYVKDLIIKKSQETYKNYEFVKDEGAIEYYVDRGFVANDTVVSNETYFNATAYGSINKDIESLWESDWEKSLSKIVSFCNKKGIEITFFISPEPEWTLVGKGDYQKYNDLIQILADKYDVDFYDFNLCRDDVFNSNIHYYFKDEDHLNTYGARTFSKLFADFFMGRIAAQDAFYESFDDKIRDKNIGFYGIAGPSIDDAAGVRSYNIISGDILSNEFRIIVSPNEGEQRMVQDFSSNIQFEIPIDENGILTIVWRNIDDTENVQTVEIEY